MRSCSVRARACVPCMQLDHECWLTPRSRFRYTLTKDGNTTHRSASVRAAPSKIGAVFRDRGRRQSQKREGVRTSQLIRQLLLNVNRVAAISQRQGTWVLRCTCIYRLPTRLSRGMPNNSASSCYTGFNDSVHCGTIASNSTVNTQ